MAASIALEEESGVYARHQHSHNGYYAGDFTTSHPVPAAAWQTPLTALDSF
jgi:hypothetical protein